MTERLFITLATRNGGRFLSEQLDSLLEQSLTDWVLLVRDDFSDDGTVAIIDRYVASDPRIEHQALPTTRIGSAAGNFAGLLEEAHRRGAEYVFCCDQDDVWAPDKLQKMMAALQKAEGSERKPCLVHHDLAVVGADLAPGAESYWKLMALEPGSESSPQRLLSRNEVTGCAMACNRALLELALPIPEQAIMHDWWLALFAAFCGRLEPVDEPLVSYRQHGANVIGAKSYRAGLNPLQNWFSTWRAGNDEFLGTVQQARAFSDALVGNEAVGEPLRASVQTYSSLPRLGRLARLRALRAAGVWRHKLLLDAVLVARMILLAREASE